MPFPRFPRRWALLAAVLVTTSVLPAFAASAGEKASDDSAEAYRRFAMQNEGDAQRGQALFQDAGRVGCSKCHSLDGKGGSAGPDLFSVGDQFPRSELIDSVLNPSARIAVGYSTTILEDRSGEEHQGVLKQVTADWVELACGDGNRVRIPSDAIRDQRGSNCSLMPEGLQAGLSKQEFGDLIEYLVSLKQPGSALSSHRGMPEEIPPLARSIGVVPFLEQNLEWAPPAPGVQTGLVWFDQIPGHPGRFLALHQAGVIWLVEKSPAGQKTTVFLDLTREVFSLRGPNGLLGMTFHPRFRENRRYYLQHQVFEDRKIVTVLEEREMTEDCRHDSGHTPRPLLRIPSVAEHHSGGCIQFGPDGYLYFGMGDSAPNFDPQGYAQDLRLLLGKMLRIDVNRAEGGLAYGIPADNPFRDRPDARPEIWALGLREPWRFSFDRATGDLWVADLGQERGDEVDIVRRGENCGWNVYEGFDRFSSTHRKEGTEYLAPLFAGRRKHGIAVVGGHVYRGAGNPTFQGVYVFGDHQSKRIWGLTQSDRKLETVHELGVCPQWITAFAMDEAGDLYVVGYQGMVYRLDFRGSRFDEIQIPAPATTAAVTTSAR